MHCAAGLAGPNDAGSNAEVQYPDGDGTFTMLAKRRIRKGEEVSIRCEATPSAGMGRCHHPCFKPLSENNASAGRRRLASPSRGSPLSGRRLPSSGAPNAPSQTFQQV